METRPVAKPWFVKFDGPCSKCGTTLLAGTPAVWDNRARKMSCIECPPTASPIVEPPLDVGVAGSSARREHDRRAAKREKEVRDRWGDRVGGWVLKLTAEPQSTAAWAIGARGEEKLAEALADIPDLIVLNDRLVPRTRGNIDHIVVAPAGVFVVDAKYYEGLIHIENVGPFWRSEARLYVGRRDKSKLAEGLGWQVEAVRTALMAAAVEPAPPLTPVLCFIEGEWPWIRPPDEYNGVRLESPGSLTKLLTSSTVLDGASIRRLARILATALPAK